MREIIKLGPILLVLALPLSVPGQALELDNVIRLNQVGYYPGASKHAVVPAEAGDRFAVVTADGREVHVGRLTPARVWPHSGERVRLADFSELRQPGEYRLRLADGTESYAFQVSPQVYREVATSAAKAFYFQRASAVLRPEYAGQWSRPAGHPETLIEVHPSAATKERPAGTILAAPYGWYDAGDYNKYIVNSGISTYQVLAIHEHFPEYTRALDLNIPESGGRLPDLLAEAWWNLRWMLAMQDPHDGGVYHKLTTAGFEGMVMPHHAVNRRYVVQKSTAAALAFAAVMAQASRLLRGHEAALPGIPDSMRAAAVRAWEWAQAHPGVVYDQERMNQRFDPDVSTGAYGGRDLADEFSWAAVELFVTTGDEAFLEAVPDHARDWGVPSWSSVGTLGHYTLLHHRDRVGAVARIHDVERQLLGLADELRDSYRQSTYRVAMGAEARDFVWGSNAVAANQSMALIQAFRLTGDPSYLEAAVSNLDYVLGRNATGYSFVTGYGANPVRNPHHRPSEADGIVDPVPGLLSGGPNPGQQDARSCEAQGVAYPSDLPAISFLDHSCSYAANEIAINWNAPLAYVAHAIEALRE